MWLQVIVVAANITGYTPVWQLMVAAIAVQIVADTVQQFQIRKRTTSYLDKVNQELFMPRGQYAMIMKFTDKPIKPKKNKNGTNESADPLGDMFTMEQLNRDGSGVNTTAGGPAEFDASATISKYTNTEDHPDMGAWKSRMKGFRLESGHTQGEGELPESAPLIYPRIDRAAQRIAEGKEAKSSFQTGRTWARDYEERKNRLGVSQVKSVISVNRQKPLNGHHSNPSLYQPSPSTESITK